MLRIIYSFILYLLVPFAVLRLFFLGFRNLAYRARWRERFGFPGKITSHNKIIWLHAVSVGEVQASRPLVESLQAEYSDYKILLTTMTPTGADCVRKYFSDDVKHLYLPYDLPLSIKNFISNVDPLILIIMETELWPNLFYYCRKKNVPVIIVNARMSEKSVNGYRYFPSLTRATLQDISLIVAQEKRDAKRFVRLGADADKVSIVGNLKFDIHFPHSIHEQAKSLRRYFSMSGTDINRPIWIAASTHEGEEKIILNAFERILEKHPKCLLIIAPRHPERSENVRALCGRGNLEVLSKSDNKEFNENIKVFILDTLGELPMYYASADVAFVGGSLTEAGGHNMLEPACLGLPVIMGPHVFNFQAISQLLIDEGAAWRVANVYELSSIVSDLLSDANLRASVGERGRNVVLRNRGNVKKIMESIMSLI